MAYELLRQMLEESQQIMVFSGMGMIRESGISYFKDEPYAYQVEAKYGVSPEEFLSAAYYNTRPGPFYKFYKEEMLRDRSWRTPNAAHYALARLEQQKESRGGKVIVATRSLSGLHQKAGAKNVIELYGNMYRNRCIRCGKEFTAEYLLEAPGIPHCDVCQGAIRPGILLSGERLDNGIITWVANETGKADMLLVVGTHLDSYLTRRFRHYYNGTKLVLITDEHHPTDQEADMLIYEKVSDVLPQVID
ncbi:MAG: NAD-dependent deacetylase [Lachnospiraceae bacterium]|nr:NAD-dependent deacetylase [Lachnospiraceae bacterium]